MAAPTLAVLPSFYGIRLSDGRVVLLGRFLSGMAAYRRTWRGRLLALVEPIDESALERNQDRTLGGDNVTVTPGELDFDLELVDFESPRFRELLAEADVALSGVHYRQNHISRVGRAVGVPVVYNSEYTLKTRLQIARVECSSSLRLARRMAWEVNQERQIRRAMRLSQGLQANGVPTYEAYRHLTPSSMLYFDGRMSADKVVTDDVLEPRLQRMLEGGPLRLTWSGRMNKMKGVDQLVEVARHLAALKVDFTLDVFGGGVLLEPLQADVKRLGLEDKVHLRGYVPFDELTRLTQRDHDMWVCCHVQGDPSGAYLETFGNGLPIAGYDNEALLGMLNRISAGRTAPVGEPEQLARLIADLAGRRKQLADWARAGVAFARAHTFDKAFDRRLQHLESVAEAHAKPSARRAARSPA